MQFLKPIFPAFRMWQYCGLTPLSLEANFSSTKFYKYYSYFIIFIQVITFVLGIVYNDVYVNWTVRSVMSYMDLITLNSVRFLTIIIHIEALVKRNEQIKFYRKLQQVDKLFSEHLGVYQDLYSLRNITIFDCACHFMELLVMYVTNIICSKENNLPKFLNYWLIYSVAFVISNIRYIQFTTFIRLIKVRVELIHCSFKRIISFENFTLSKVKFTVNDQVDKKCKTLNFDTETSLVYEEVVLLRQCYYLLWEASSLTNKCFHWTMPFAIGNDFCTLVTNLYWIFLWIVEPKMSNSSILAVSIVWSLANIRHIIIITNVCQQTVEKVLV